MSNEISESQIKKYQEDFNQVSAYKVAERAATKNGINNVSINEELLRKMRNTFNVEIDAGDVCNQKQSGRCWMFAGLNVLRTILMEKFHVKNIELSQAYLQFYDKLEKANFFFNRVIELANEEPNSRLNTFLLDNALGDGGHFAMFTNLVKKYGVVPSSEMPDSAISENTRELNSTLTEYCAQGMLYLREAIQKHATKERLAFIKDTFMNNIYRILTISLGVPPTSFTYEYKDKDNQYHIISNITPKAFYDEYIGQDLNDYVCLSDAPIQGMKPFVKYTSRYVNNVEGGDPVYFFNVPLDSLKEAAIASLKDNRPIWFAADVHYQALRKEGILADGIIRSDALFNINFDMNKEARLTYRASFCNHAMTFTGVNLKEDGTPNRWKVENSWGKENGKDGFYVMSDRWFNEYVYQIFVNRKYVPAEILEKLDKAEVVEEEPFNTLYVQQD